MVLKLSGLAGELLPGLDDDVSVSLGQSLKRGRTARIARAEYPQKNFRENRGVDASW
jgi:hypothetical protein